jgi:3-deoxy-D-manno-octulosonic-acid transferase
VYGLYSFFLFLALLLYFPVYFIRLKLGRKERLHLRERLGMGRPRSGPDAPSLWIHAVSVGEVLSLRRLVSELRARHPSWVVYFSTLTETGYRVARQTLSGVEEVIFVPIDFGFIVRRFYADLRPRVFILAESEFWPNLLRQARRSCRSVILINGRISDRSAARYYRWRRVFLPVLRNIDTFLVQTDKDLERLNRVGIPRPSLEVAGNLKADILLPAIEAEDLRNMRTEFGLPRKTRLIVAGSTHPGEETLLLKAFREAKSQRPDLALVLAPRHPERSKEVEKAAASTGLKPIKRTAAGPKLGWDVLILDTIGELTKFYALADLAFVGGSLVPHGGQNLLEPAYYGKPLCFGTHMENFAALADSFVAAGAARVVRGPDDLAGFFMLQDEKELEEMGRKARALLSSFQGATERTLQVIESRFGEGAD